MNGSIRNHFAKQLRKLRKKHGLTQQKLAELAELDYKHIQRLESSRPADVKLETLHKLAQAFQISCSELLNFSDDHLKKHRA